MAAMALSEWEGLENPASARLELVDGQVVLNPQPRVIHQHVVRVLSNALADACSPEFITVCGVEWRFPAEDPAALWHVRIPDVLVAVAGSLRGQAALVGDGPLVVVEVLSPGNRKPDIARKRTLYFEHGARFYAEVTITRDEQEAAITWYRRGHDDWEEVALARGDAVLTVVEPFELSIRPNGLLF
jgi:Uma2 family endonuclease